MSRLSQVLTEMFSYAHGNMPLDALERLSRTVHEFSVNMAQESVTILEGVAMLIESDARPDVRTKAGSLQHSEDISCLLCDAAQKFDLIAGLMQIERDAECHIAQRTPEDDADPGGNMLSANSVRNLEQLHE